MANLGIWWLWLIWTQIVLTPNYSASVLGPLTTYEKLRVAHAAGMPGTFSPKQTKETLISYPGMHHGTCVTHVPWCMSEPLNRGGGENVPVIPEGMRNPQFYASKRPMRHSLCPTSYTPLSTWGIHIQYSNYGHHKIMFLCQNIVLNNI